MRQKFDVYFSRREYDEAFKIKNIIDAGFREITKELEADYSSFREIGETTVSPGLLFQKMKLLKDGRVALPNVNEVFVVDLADQKITPLVRFSTTTKSITARDIAVDDEGTVYVVGLGKGQMGSVQCYRDNKLIWHRWKGIEISKVKLSKNYLLCVPAEMKGLSPDVLIFSKEKNNANTYRGVISTDLDKSAANESCDYLVGPYNVSEGTSAIYNIKERKPMKFFGRPKGLTGLSPDGAYYAFYNKNRKIQIVETGTTKRREIDIGLIPESTLEFAPVFLPGEKLLIAVNTPNKLFHYLHICDLKTGKREKEYMSIGHLTHLDVNADGSRITKMVQYYSVNGRDVADQRIKVLGRRWEFRKK